MSENNHLIRTIVQSDLLKRVTAVSENRYPTLKARQDSIKETVQDFIKDTLVNNNKFTEEEMMPIIKEELKRKGFSAYCEEDIEMDEDEEER